MMRRMKLTSACSAALLALACRPANMPAGGPPPGGK